jgi:hypothetical protein
MSPCVGLVSDAAQVRRQIDADIGQKDHLWMANSYIIATQAHSQVKTWILHESKASLARRLRLTIVTRLCIWYCDAIVITTPKIQTTKFSVAFWKNRPQRIGSRSSDPTSQLQDTQTSEEKE